MKTSILKKSLLVATLALPLTALAQPGDGLCDGQRHHHAQMHDKGHHGHGDGMNSAVGNGAGSPQGDTRRAESRDGFHRHVLHGLDLNDAQRDQIRQIMQENRPKMRYQAMNMREHRRDLHQLAAADTVDEARLQELSAQTAQAMGEMAAQRVAARQKMQERGAFRPHPGGDLAPAPGT